MPTLNSKATALKDKYIRQSTEKSFVDTRKKRGLQAEINKVESIRKIIINNRIDELELGRLRVELAKMISTIDDLLSLEQSK